MDYTDLHLLNAQVDIILQALQLYAFNLHNTFQFAVVPEDYEIKNALIFHTYEEIINNHNYNQCSYDVLKACRIELKRHKRKIYYKNKKVA